MPPVVGFIGGLLTAVSPTLGFGALGIAGASGVGGFLAGTGLIAGVSAFAATAFGGFLVNTLLGIGLNLLVAALAPKPQSPPPSQRLVNIRQSVPDRTKSYGLVRVGGPVFFWRAKAPKRYYGVLFNTGEIDGIEVVHLDERVVSLDVDGFVTTTEYQSGGRSRVQVETFLGASGQTSPVLLNDNFAEWTDDHKMTGLAGIVVVAENVPAQDFSSVYPSGREPTVTGLIRGTKCYDPRTDSIVWTKNAALIFADWATSPDGLGREVDWDEVAAEANICDQNVTDRDGNIVKRWELSGTYSFSEQRDTVRANMAVGCDMFIYERVDGKVGFKVGRWIEPTVTLTADDFYSLNLVEGNEGTQTVNAFSVQYTEPDIGYREQECAAIQIDDGQAYEQSTIQAFWIPNHNQASRIAKRILLQQRAQYRLSGSLKLTGLNLRGERFFYVNVPELGIESQAFEVGRLEMTENGTGFEIEATSVSSDDFGFVAATEEGEKPVADTPAAASSIDVPTGLTASSVSVSGGVVGFLEWNAPSSDTLVNTIRYKATAESDWFEVSVPQGQAYQYTSPLIDGVQYDAQVRAQSQGGRVSDWTTTVQFTAIVDVSAPGVVTSVSATGGSGTVDISWTSPNSANYAASRIYRNTVDTFGTSSLVHTEYGAPNSTDTYQDGGLSAGTYYYWVVSVNGSGVAATEVGTGAVVVT